MVRVQVLLQSVQSCTQFCMLRSSGSSIVYGIRHSSQRPRRARVRICFRLSWFLSKQTDDDQDQDDHKQKVDPAARKAEWGGPQEAKQPQDEQYDNDGLQHGVFLSLGWYAPRIGPSLAGSPIRALGFTRALRPRYAVDPPIGTSLATAWRSTIRKRLREMRGA